MVAVSPVDRFERFVDRRGTHHRWLGSPDPRTGTGQFRLDGKLRSAQRAAWQLHVGPLPAGVRVRACRQDPSCVRIEHLRIEASRRDIAPTSTSGSYPLAHVRVAAVFPLYLRHLHDEGRADTTLSVYQSIFAGWLDKPLPGVTVGELSPTRIAKVVETMAAVPSAAAVAGSLLRGLASWAARPGYRSASSGSSAAMRATASA